MSLFEIDKSSDNRSQPTISASDPLNVGAVKAHATDGIAYRAENATGTPRVVSRDDQIIVFDGSFNKALFGRDGSGNFVVKIAQDGFDVLTATSAQLIFNSANNIFKIVKSATIDLGTSTVVSGTANTATVAHGLSSAPLAIAFGTVTDVTNGTRTVPLPHYTLGTTSGISSTVRVVVASLTISTDATNINFSLRGNAIDTSATVRYYIIQETATSS